MRESPNPLEPRSTWITRDRIERGISAKKNNELRNSSQGRSGRSSGGGGGGNPSGEISDSAGVALHRQPCLHPLKLHDQHDEQLNIASRTSGTNIQKKEMPSDSGWQAHKKSGQF